jgi:hypothetical protein
MMRRKLDPLARRNAPTSLCLGAAPDQPQEPRRFPRGIALLVAVVLLLAFAPSAFASIQFVTKWGSSGSGNGQFGSPHGIALNSSGEVYVADDGDHNDRIQKFDSSGAFLAKFGSYGFDNGQFSSPWGLATDSSDNIYVADVDSQRIQKFSSSGAFLAKWGSQGSGAGQFSTPLGVATDSSDNVYVAELNNRIQKFNSSGSFISTWGWGVRTGAQRFETCTSSCRRGISGSGNGQFNDPYALAIDSSDNVYVADTFNNRIQKFSSSGAFIRTWGGPGSANGKFNFPAGIATDSSDNVYVTELNNNRIQKFNSSGAFLAKWGSYGAGNGQFDGPSGIAINPSRDVYVGDAGNDRIQKFHLGTTPPDTTITGGPSGTTDDPTPTFSFSSAQPNTSFSCKVDSGPYTACSSPKAISHVDDGSHTFYVRATDPGATDPTPAARTFTVRTASVSVSGTTVVVTAAVGANDSLLITLPNSSTLRVTDSPSGPYTGSGIHTGAGCTRSGDYTANCHGEITQIQVNAADQGDKVVNSTGVPSSLNGGPANDTLIGGTASDTLIGGPGADVMKGMNGNDQLLARDLTSDTTINCDGGIGSPGPADRADLDLLPKDPDSAVTNCETKTRH